MNFDDDVEWYEHVIRVVRDTKYGNTSTDEWFREIKRNEYGYVPGEEISPEKFTRLCNRDDTEVRVETNKEKVTGTSRITKDVVVEHVKSVSVIVSFEGDIDD